MAKSELYIRKRDLTVYAVRRPTPIEIVCGDCSTRTDEAGNPELLPVRTLLAMDGRCFTCGGRSFVIASELCFALRRTITERKRFELTGGYNREAEASLQTEPSPWATVASEVLRPGAVEARDTESERSSSLSLCVN